MEDKNNNKSHELLNEEDFVDFDDDMNLEGLGVPNLPQGESTVEQKNQVSTNPSNFGAQNHTNQDKFNQLIFCYFQTKDKEEDKNPEQADQEPTQQNAQAQKPAEATDQNERDLRSVFVKNVHFSADDNEITEFFKECGKIVTITIKKDKFTRQSLGYCFIEFETSQGALKA